VVAVVLAVLTALTIGLSRVALGVHYLSDVLGGYVLGAAWLTAMTALFAAWRHEIGPPPSGASRRGEPDDGGGPARPRTEPTGAHRK
jgi:undecaprenyl-diphosphatase